MASCSDRVLDLLTRSNKPFNAQGVADMVAQHGFKKGQVQRSLDDLAETGKISAKEFGKAKIYFPAQGCRRVLSKEELAAKQAKAMRLSEQARAEEKEVLRLEQELASLKSSLTLNQIKETCAGLESKAKELESDLTELQKGTNLVSTEDRQQAEADFIICIEQWRKRRAIFRQIWDAVSENMDRKKSDLFEEIGIETDDQAGCSLEELSRLLPKRRRR